MSQSHPGTDLLRSKRIQNESLNFGDLVELSAAKGEIGFPQTGTNSSQQSTGPFHRLEALREFQSAICSSKLIFFIFLFRGLALQAMHLDSEHP